MIEIKVARSLISFWVKIRREFNSFFTQTLYCVLFYEIHAYNIKTSILGWNCMKGSNLFKHKQIEERAAEIAAYIIDNNATVRQTAKQFGISKSTVHKDVTERLLQINPSLAERARVVLDLNKSERHIRGGLATKEKYLHKDKIQSY